MFHWICLWNILPSWQRTFRLISPSSVTSTVGACHFHLIGLVFNVERMFGQTNHNMSYSLGAEKGPDDE